MERGESPLFVIINMISEKLVRQLIEEKISGTDYYILNLSISPGNNIKVEIESTKPVSISDCVDISRQVEHNLDREAEDFSLSVSSPGVGEPLQDYRQYVKNIGREVNIRLTDGSEIAGTLISADEKSTTVEHSFKQKIEGTKKKEIVTEVKTLDYDKIKETKVQISFK